MLWPGFELLSYTMQSSGGISIVIPPKASNHNCQPIHRDHNQSLNLTSLNSKTATNTKQQINQSINIRLITAWQNAGQRQRMNNIQIHKYSVSKHCLRNGRVGLELCSLCSFYITCVWESYSPISVWSVEAAEVSGCVRYQAANVVNGHQCQTND